MPVISITSVQPPIAVLLCQADAKGQDICKVVSGLYERQLKSLQQVGGVGMDDLEALNKSLIRLEQFWTDQIRYQL